MHVRIEEPQPGADAQRGEQIDSRPAQRRIVAREQRPHQHDAERIEHRVFGVQMHEMRAEQAPPLPAAMATRHSSAHSRDGVATQLEQAEQRADPQQREPVGPVAIERLQHRA